MTAAPSPPGTPLADRVRNLAVVSGALRQHRLMFTKVLLVSYALMLTGVGCATLSVLAATSLVTGATDRPAVALVVVLAAAVVALAVLSWTDSWLSHVLAYRVINSLRLAVHGALARLAPLGLGRRRSGETAAAAMSDIEALEWFFAHTLAQLAAGLLAAATVSSVVISWWGSPGFIVVAAQLLLLVVPAIGSRLAARQGTQLRTRIGALSATAMEGRQSARELLLLDLLEEHRGRLRRETRAIQQTRQRIALRTGAEQAGIEAVTAAAVLAVLVVVTARVNTGQLAAEQIPVATVLASAALAPVLAMVAGLQRLGEMAAAAQRVDEVLHAPASRVDGGDEVLVARPEDVGRVQAVTLDVAYPLSDRAVLSSLDVELQPGEHVALVGASGAGKTTLLHTLVRLFDPAVGELRIDGFDVRRERSDRTRRRITLVAQQPHVFRCSVRDNLLVADPDRSDAEIWQALIAVGLADFVASLPDGLDASLAEHGGTWSGGQRQRLGLARGLLVDAEVLALDEPTANLDAVSEEQLMTTVADLRRDRTTIIASHRTSTIARCGRVLLLDGGRIIADGTHAQLVAEVPRYREILATTEEPPPAPPDQSSTTVAGPDTHERR